MKFKAIIALATCALLTTACDDTNPTATAKTAALALHKGKLGSFSRMLSGQAKETYGNSEGFDNLRESLRDRNLKLGAETFESGHGTDEGRTENYTIPVIDEDTGSTLVKLTLVCEFSQVPCLYGAVVIPNCTPTDSEHCLVDEIKP